MSAIYHLTFIYLSSQPNNILKPLSTFYNITRYYKYIINTYTIIEDYFYVCPRHSTTPMLPIRFFFRFGTMNMLFSTLILVRILLIVFAWFIWLLALPCGHSNVTISIYDDDNERKRYNAKRKFANAANFCIYINNNITLGL